MTAAQQLATFVRTREFGDLSHTSCEVRTIDLESETLPAHAYDLVACFDVLEHIPKPLEVVRNIRRSLRENGLFVMHAPFGEDPIHPNQFGARLAALYRHAFRRAAPPSAVPQGQPCGTR